MSSLRVVLATFGSLGDLHPYIALGRALQQRGHDPVLATMDRYREAVLATGLRFAPVSPPEDAFPPMGELMPRLFDPWRGPEYMLRKLVMPYVREAHADLSRICNASDVLVTHPLAVTGPLIVGQTGMPWASTMLSPMSLLSSHDPSLFPPMPWLYKLRRFGVGPYRRVFALFRLLCHPWEAPLRALRADLGLPPSDTLATFEGQFSPALNLALFPELLAARQTDWPANTHACGFARYDGQAPDPAITARLQRFLDAGGPQDAPLVFALGSSAVMIAGDFWQHAIAAARKLGRRAILITAQADRDIDERIAEFAYLPYSLVFPHAAAIVHQAGIGTLSQALTAGRPQLIVPVAFDQPDNALRTARLGVSRTLPFRQVSAERLVRELQSLLENPEYLLQAAQIAPGVSAQDGAAEAARLIETLGAGHASQNRQGGRS
jgi:rhamnosyltransferase subunit B